VICVCFSGSARSRLAGEVQDPLPRDPRLLRLPGVPEPGRQRILVRPVRRPGRPRADRGFHDGPGGLCLRAGVPPPRGQILSRNMVRHAPSRSDTRGHRQAARSTVAGQPEADEGYLANIAIRGPNTFLNLNSRSISHSRMCPSVSELSSILPGRYVATREALRSSSRSRFSDSPKSLSMLSLSFCSESPRTRHRRSPKQTSTGSAADRSAHR